MKLDRYTYDWWNERDLPPADEREHELPRTRNSDADKQTPPSENCIYISRISGGGLTLEQK